MPEKVSVGELIVWVIVETYLVEVDIHALELEVRSTIIAMEGISGARE